MQAPPLRLADHWHQEGLRRRLPLARSVADLPQPLTVSLDSGLVKRLPIHAEVQTAFEQKVAAPLLKRLALRSISSRSHEWLVLSRHSRCAWGGHPPAARGSSNCGDIHPGAESAKGFCWRSGWHFRTKSFRVNETTGVARALAPGAQWPTLTSG